MDALTAALALIIAQFCIALVMAGAYVVARPERCTGYWAAAAAAIMVGVLAIVFAHRVPALQMLGNICLVFGAVLQLGGLQAFYKAPRGVIGWIVGAAACALFVLLWATDATLSRYILVLASALLVLLALSSRVMLAGMQSRRTFASVLTLGAIAVLMLNNIVRIVMAIREDPHLLATAQSPARVSILYLVPLGGIFLYATGLLLLYFERLVRDKNHLATHDDLTGLLNRRAIVERGEREVAVAIRQRQPLTVAFVDIDYLKHVNDNRGHDAGDLVIANIAHLLRNVCRATDLVGRYGGDEFCLIFPGAGMDHAAILGERLLGAARQQRFHEENSVTLSVGFASLNESGGEQSWADLIRSADMALYQAKQMGRDGFCIAGQESGPTASTTGSDAGNRFA